MILDKGTPENKSAPLVQLASSSE